MAITRAQQVRQMLEDGGMLVQPSMTGKRPGYRGPGGYRGGSGGSKDKGKEDKSTAEKASESYGRGEEGPSQSYSDQLKDIQKAQSTARELGINLSQNQNEDRTRTIDDIKLGGVDRSAVMPGSTFDDNRIALMNLRGATLPDPNTPFKALNLGLNLLKPIREFGYEKNKDFFIKNVAGKYGYGYDEDEFERYMMERGAGEVSAYGNPALGQNAINARGGGDGPMQSTMAPVTTMPVPGDPGETLPVEPDSPFVPPKDRKLPFENYFVG